jgi:hypothetical protein
MKKARNLLFELWRIEGIAERSCARENLPLDFGREISPAHDHGRAQTMQYAVFLLDQGHALFSVCI